MSESLEKLHNRILSDAKLKAEQILAEANQKAAEIREKAKKEAEQEAEQILAKGKLDAEAVRRGILSSKLRANRLKILEEKNRIVENVIQSVEQELSMIAGSNQFQNTLKRLVTEAVDAIGSEEPIVRVGFKEASKNDLEQLGKSLPRGSKFVVENQPIDGLGGVVASDPQGKIVFSNSFRSRLERLDNQLFTLIASTLFNE